jgi:hypothetical protein
MGASLQPEPKPKPSHKGKMIALVILAIFFILLGITTAIFISGIDKYIVNFQL